MTTPLTCEDAELILSEMSEPRSVELERHLQTCQSCRQSAQLFSLAALPQPAAYEHAKLSQLPALTLNAFRTAEKTHSRFQRLIGYAAAAGLGALVASAAMLSMRAPQVPEHTAPMVNSQQRASDATLAANDAVFAGLQTGEDELADDFVSYELSWPAITEGEEQ